MKLFRSVVLLVLSAAVVNAQQTTTPRTPPAPPSPVRPAPAPKPAQAPRAIIHPDDFSVAFDGLHYLNLDGMRLDAEKFRIDADLLRLDAQRMATEMKDRAWDYSFDAKIAGDLARDEAMRATEKLRDMNWSGQIAEVAKFGASFGAEFAPKIAQTVGDAFAYSGAGAMAYAYAPTPQARWDNRQDQDPADSLFRVAYDAMNRGEYRRSADLFQQVQSRFPKSTRTSNAAYNEALMRYKIGSTDELKSALRVLSDKSKFSSTSSSFNNEISILTTRVRGALAARGDSEQAAIIRTEAQQGGGCDREEMQVRAEALSSLANTDMNTATPMLRRVLDKREPCSLDLRRRALSILLRRADTAATNAAISVAKNADETLELRLDAVRYLSKLPGDNALSTLEDLLRNSTDRDVQRTAVSALANSENSRARSSVRTVVERNDVSEELRMEALNTFSKERSSSDDAAYLRGLYPKVTSERIKQSVMQALSRIGGAENDQFLLAVARNTGESTEVRSSAINRIARTSSTISASDISRLYDNAESRSLRIQIVNALANRKDPEALDKLISILKTGTDSSVRTQIISYLSRNPDPKAKQALVEFAGGGR